MQAGVVDDELAAMKAAQGILPASPVDDELEQLGLQLRSIAHLRPHAHECAGQAWQRAGSDNSVRFARNCDGDRSIQESPPWVPCRDVKVAVTCPMDASPGDVASVETEHGEVEMQIPEGVDGGA